MRLYKVSVMDSEDGFYTGVWRVLDDDVHAINTREALKKAAPISRYFDESQRPKLSRPRPSIAIYEYRDCKYAVEQL